MSDVKSYAKQITQGYTSALKRLEKKYDALTGAIDEEYLARNREINQNNVKSKNAASANYKTSLANAQKNLLDRGLEKSGESVNTEIRSNLSKNSAFAALDAEAESARQANALSRSQEKSRLISSRLEEEADLEDSMNRALREQYNLDREYEADRADAAEDSRRWEAEAAEDNHRWRTENAQSAAKTEHDMKMDEMEFAAEQVQRAFENSMDEREFAADEAQRAFENAVQSGNSTANNSYGTVSTKGVAQKVSPEYTAQEFVNKIYKHYDQIYSINDRNKAVEKAIYQVLNDTTLDPTYKVQVRVYATALGYI